MSSSSNANVLIDLPALINRYPPGLTLGAWRSPSPSTSLTQSPPTKPNHLHHATHNSNNKRPGLRLPYPTRRAPPPPSSRVRFPAEPPIAISVSTTTTTSSAPIASFPDADALPVPVLGEGDLMNVDPPSIRVQPPAHGTARPRLFSLSLSSHRPHTHVLQFATQPANPPPSQHQTHTRTLSTTNPFIVSSDASPTAPPTPVPVEVLQRQRAAEVRDARARVVAGILLHRVHAVGKPMRRRPVLGAPERGYVRSGLSRMVCVGDC